MIIVPVTHHRFFPPDLTATVAVSDAAGARLALVTKAGLRVNIAQRHGLDPRPIEVTLEDDKGTYVKLTAQDLPNLPDGSPHPQGTLKAVEKILLEFSPEEFEKFSHARSQPTTATRSG